MKGLSFRLRYNNPAPALSSKEIDSWRTHDLVEDTGSIDEKSETNDLQPLESLPAESKTDHPDEQRAASVDCAAGSGGDHSGHAESEEVEAAAKKSVFMNVVR